MRCLKILVEINLFDLLLSFLAHKYLLLYALLRHLRECLAVHVLGNHAWLKPSIPWHPLQSNVVGGCAADPAGSIAAAIAPLNSLLKFIEHGLIVVDGGGHWVVGRGKVLKLAIGLEGA